MKPIRKNYNILDKPVGPYVHAVKHNNLLYLSGLSAFGSKTQSKSIEFQTKEIFNQIEKIAKAENSSLQNIIKVTIFVTNFENISELRTTLFEIYKEDLPASSLVKIESLFHPDLKIEIEAIIAI